MAELFGEGGRSGFGYLRGAELVICAIGLVHEVVVVVGEVEQAEKMAHFVSEDVAEVGRNKIGNDRGLEGFDGHAAEMLAFEFVDEQEADSGFWRELASEEEEAVFVDDIGVVGSGRFLRRERTEEEFHMGDIPDLIGAIEALADGFFVDARNDLVDVFHPACLDLGDTADLNVHMFNAKAGDLQSNEMGVDGNYERHGASLHGSMRR